MRPDLRTPGVLCSFIKSLLNELPEWAFKGQEKSMTWNGPGQVAGIVALLYPNRASLFLRLAAEQQP